MIDKAARVPDDLYKSVRPMLAVSGGRLVCLSTPFGPGGFFHSEWSDPDQGRADHLNHAMAQPFAFFAGDEQDDQLEYAACRLLFALETADES